MKLNFTNKINKKWRIDDDGFLRITLCCLKEGVFEYGAEEFPSAMEHETLRGKEVFWEYIPASELKKEEALNSLEGKDILAGDHDWQTPLKYQTADIVGCVCGKPYCENGELLCDAIIKDARTIENITSERTNEADRYVEVSAGYEGDLEVEPGSFNGQAFDAKQLNFRFNHIALLPKGQGRCGKDVRIINAKSERGRGMGETMLKIRIGNTERSYRFSNEQDAGQAESMLEEERRFNAEAVEESLKAKDALTAQLSDLQAQLAEHDERLKQAKIDLERAIGIENQEAVAAELVDQAASEEEIVDAEAADGWTEEGAGTGTDGILNSIRVKPDGKKANLAERRQNIVRAVMKNRKVEIPDTWEQNAYDAAFETLAITAKIQNAKRTENAQRVLNGKPTAGTVDKTAGDNRARMLNAMKLKKGAAK